MDDIKLPDMLHAAVLRSPYAHARIRSIDVSAARNLPGVVAILTGADIAGVLPDIPTRAMTGERAVDELRPPEHPLLAKDKVCYVGQAVAVVVAQDPVRGQGCSGAHRGRLRAPVPSPRSRCGRAQTMRRSFMRPFGTNVAMRVRQRAGDLDGRFRPGRPCHSPALCGATPGPSPAGNAWGDGPLSARGGSPDRLELDPGTRSASSTTYPAC